MLVNNTTVNAYVTQIRLQITHKHINVPEACRQRISGADVVFVSFDVLSILCLSPHLLQLFGGKPHPAFHQHNDWIFIFYVNVSFNEPSVLFKPPHKPRQRASMHNTRGAQRNQLNQFSHCSSYYLHLWFSDSNVRKTDEKTVSTSLKSLLDMLNSPSERPQLTARLLWTRLMQKTVSSSGCTALWFVISLMSSLINKPVTLFSLCLLL